MTTATRGQCPVCRYSCRLRKDGTLQAHHGYHGHDPAPECAGSGQWPVTRDVMECGGCMEYLHSQPHLAGACASVGIGRGKGTGQVLREYLSAFHERGHRAVA